MKLIKRDLIDFFAIFFILIINEATVKILIAVSIFYVFRILYYLFFSQRLVTKK